MPTSTHCTICGGTTFEPAFQGRLFEGQAPKCANCGSLERHRAIFAAYQPLRKIVADWRALHFAPDPAVDANWFKTYQPSTFGGQGSLDMTATGLPDASFDIAISNHVLEHVGDDTQAIREQLRLVGPAGLVHVTVPLPTSWARTRDWGFADPDKNNHYRGYGADFPARMKARVPEALIVAAVARDPVTGRHEWIYWFSHANQTVDRLTAALLANRIPAAIF